MNQKIYSLVLVLLLASSSACHDELFQEPITDKSAANFFSTETEIEEAVNGAYSVLQWTGLYNVYVPVIGEISSDNTFDEVPANDGGRYGQLDEFSVITSNPVVAGIWKDSYRGIQRTNVVLSRIGDVAFEDPEVKTHRTGEMKFLRALFYFNLVRLFGDVPLVTEETTNVNDYFGQARTPVSEVYTQLLKDLTEAVGELPEEAAQTGRITQAAAQALLGKVQLTQGNFGEAATQLQAIKAAGKHQLLGTPAELFAIDNENNAEVIFSVEFASGINGNSEGSDLYQQTAPSGTVNGAKGHNLPTISLYQLFDENDLRREAFIGLTEENIPFSRKYAKPDGDPSDGGSNFVVLRYADVLLMLAEAQNEQGNTADALTNLNLVRQRAGLDAVTAGSQEAVRRAIALERRFELVNEGHRWFDLKRTGQAIDVMNTWFAAEGINVTIDQNDLLFPIPESQTDTDPALQQNPGY